MSVDRGIKAPSFNSIKTSLYKEINKKLTKDILNLNEAPENSLYYKTLDEENFAVYKDSRNFIVFCEATFFICPSFSYQVFITRVYSNTTKSYYTTSFSIMSGKNINDYKKVFSELHNNIKKYVNIGESFEITELHTDFEFAIGLGCKKEYPNLIVKNCIWHA